MNYSNQPQNLQLPIAANNNHDTFSIPVKICDGLFMADRHIAQVLISLFKDIEFF